MKENVKFICIKVPRKGNFKLNSVYVANNGWYDAFEGETELRIWDDDNICYSFRDYGWLEFFEEV